MKAANNIQIVQLVQRGLDLLDAQEAAVASQETLLLDLETAAEDVVDRLQTLIDDLAKWHRLWVSNNVNALVDGAETDTSIVEGGAYEKWRWVELRAAFLSYQAWLITAVTPEVGEVPAGPLAVTVLSRRYVPPTPVEE